MEKNTEIKMPVNSATADASSSEDNSYKIKFHNLCNLTRSIFHELSQPITILLGYSEIMLSNMDANDPLYNKLLEINKQADKADEIIRRMHNKIKYIEEDNTSDSKIIGKI